MAGRQCVVHARKEGKSLGKANITNILHCRPGRFMSFQSSRSSGVVSWQGNPNCQAAHDWVLDWLKSHNAPFIGSGETVGVRRKGNLGECIAFLIGSANEYQNHHVFPANALTPLVNNAGVGVDIVWVW